MKSRLAALAATMFALTACSDAPTAARGGQPPTLADFNQAAGASTHGASQAGSSVRWNRQAIALFRARGGSPLRPNAYLSLAQYRAVLAAGDAGHGAPPRLAGAAAGASVVVLQQYYPLDSAAIDAELAAQHAALPASEHRGAFAAGEVIGRQIGAAVLAFAATDNFGLTSPGLPPVGPGYWVSSGAPIVRGGLGGRPFFLTSGSELRLPPPPEFG